MKQSIPIAKELRKHTTVDASLRKQDSHEIAEVDEDIIDFGGRDEIGMGAKTSKFVRLPPSDDEQEDVDEDVDDFINKINQKKQELAQKTEGDDDDDEESEGGSDFDFKMTKMRTSSVSVNQTSAKNGQKK